MRTFSSFFLLNLDILPQKYDPQGQNMTEWLYPGNPNKYRVIPAFRDLKKVDWQQNSSPAINDIVYIYVSGDVHQIKLKCKVNKVNLPKPEIDDRNYVIELKDPENTKYTEL